MTDSLYLRDVAKEDLLAFFAHQQDPVAHQMAGFQPREREAFMVHWTNILANESVFKQTIVFESTVAGNVLCFEASGKRLVGYWVDRAYWGRGIASRALAQFVSQIPTRPLHAYVAKANGGSIRVLEKCGFIKSDENCLGDDKVEEFLYSLG